MSKPFLVEPSLESADRLLPASSDHELSSAQCKPCLKIERDKPSDSGPATLVSVRKNTRYRLSGRIRTVNHVPASGGPGAVMNIQSGERTKDWTQVSMEFDSEDRDSIVLV